MAKEKVQDLCIIGLGAVGLYAWYCANLLELRGYALETHNQVGGQVFEVAKERLIRDLPAVTGITGEKLIRKLQKQVASVPQTIHLLLNTSALKLTQHSDYYTIHTNTNKVINTRTILITTGNGAYVPRRWEIQEDFSNVHYFIKRYQPFKNKTVAVFGGGDAAMNLALDLVTGTYKADHVVLVHRNHQFKAKPHIITAVKANPLIRLMPDYQVLKDGYTNDGNTLKSITLLDVQNKPHSLKAHAFVVQYGVTLNLRGIKEWPLQFTDTFRIKVNSKQETNLPGIFAAGDTAFSEGKLANLAIGFVEAATALYSIRDKTQGYDPIQYFGDHMVDSQL